MAKKLLALVLAVSMIFSVCAFTVYAEETDNSADVAEVAESADVETGDAEETEDETTASEEEEDVVEKSIEIDVASNYYANDKVTVTGSVEGDITGVIVRIVCDEDDVDVEETITVKKFESTGVTLQLKKATVGAEYTVTVSDFADEDTYAEKYFIIKKDASSNTGTSSTSSKNGKVTIWIEGLTARYIDETTVSLKNVDDATVMGVAEYVLDEEGRAYRRSTDKSKIDRIATTATGSTYLRDGYGTSTSSSSTKYFADCEWSYFVNGKASSLSMSEMEVEDGDEIVLYFGNPDEVIYPTITVEPDGISLGDKIEVTVTDQYGDPVKGASVYFYKRNSTTKTGGKTDSNGVYDDKTANSSFISTYQGGTVMVSYYQSSSKPILMVSVEEDLLIEREGTTAAYVTVEGAHKTLLSKTKSSKIAEYDLLNFAMEVFEDEGLDYDLNSSKDNFEYIESKNTSGYNNENGDLTDDSGWYVWVDGEIYTPEDDLEDVPVYNDDEIIFYFGDENTIPVVYYTIDGDLETDETVYVYFYSDAEKTEPLNRFYVYFTGDDVAKGMNTNSDGRVTLPIVEYKGTYTLSWGEQVGVKDDYCPYAVYTEIDLKYTGTTKPTEKATETKTETKTYECDYCGDDVTRLYNVEYKGKELDVCQSCRTEINNMNEEWATVGKEEEDTTTWAEGDYTEPTEKVTGPSPHFPDPNIDTWAVSYVDKAYEYGLMSGTGEGWFEPQREITRAEFTAIICRMLGLDTDVNSYAQVFTDVTPTDWHYGYVMAAYNAGYVTGMSATTFAPNDYITREQMAVLVARIIQVTGEETDVFLFADGYNVSLWARVYVSAVLKTGLMTGNQFGEFLPQDKVTRQTAAIVAVRLLEYMNS